MTMGSVRGFTFPFVMERANEAFLRRKSPLVALRRR